MVFLRLTNPNLFLRFVDLFFPWLAAAAGLCLCGGLYFSFMSPPDYQQGELVRIIYVHVPMAWLSMGCYFLIAVSALGTLVWRHPLADVSIRAAAPVGAVFTALTLVTGSIWALPTWGVPWVWDARLTSVLILFFLYLGLIALSHAIEDLRRSGRAVAILALVGLINLPIIKFSVNWWSTLHQPASLIRSGGPSLHPDMLRPLLMMALGFSLVFVLLYLMRMRNEILYRRVTSLRQMQARLQASPGTLPDVFGEVL
ncbi:MAG: heme ABC transporter permease [Alphaproteobacteria bacterium]|nr:heme ABC transporter permease [Alphaproteobacteria bacterium]